MWRGLPIAFPLMSIGTHRAWLRARAAACLLFACSLFRTSVGSAQGQSGDASAQTESDSRQRVSALMRQGLEEFRKKNLEGAREAFAQAWGIEQHSAIAANLADMELRLGRYRDAAEHWSYYLRNAPADRDRSDAQSAIAECRKHVASLMISAPLGTQVAINGRVVGTTPIDQELWLEPGTYAVAGRFHDGSAVDETISLAAGDARQLALAAPAVAATKPATQAAAATPREAVKPPESSRSSLRAPILVAGSVFTAIAAGAGIVFALKSHRDSESADSQSAQINAATVQAGHKQFVDAGRACNPPYGMPAAGCDALAASVDSAKRARTSAQVAFVSAGVLGVGTLAVLVLWPQSSSAANQGLRIAPWRDANGGGLAAYGSF